MTDKQSMQSMQSTFKNVMDDIKLLKMYIEDNNHYIIEQSLTCFLPEFVIVDINIERRKPLNKRRILVSQFLYILILKELFYGEYEIRTDSYGMVL